MRYIIILSLISYVLSHHSAAQSSSNCGVNPIDEYFDLPEAKRLEIGLDYLQSQEVSDRWIEHTQCLADSGDPDAQLDVAIMYRDGNIIPQNYRRATEWFFKAARNGNGMAMYNLGRIYLNGLGTEPDLVEAHIWFNLAAATLDDIDSRGLAYVYREEVGQKLTPDEINTAQDKALQIKSEIDAR